MQLAIVLMQYWYQETLLLAPQLKVKLVGWLAAPFAGMDLLKAPGAEATMNENQVVLSPLA
jgi:hypothetical protein